MNWKSGSIRLWTVATAVWLIAVFAVMRPDQDISDYFSISKVDRDVVGIAYRVELGATENATEAWLNTLQSPIFGERARLASRHNAAKSHLLEVGVMAFLPIILVPVTIFLLMFAFRWVFLGFQQGKE